MGKEQQGNASKKRTYQKPELTQVSLRPEEAVLGACKTASVSGPGQPRCTTPSSCSTIAS